MNHLLWIIPSITIAAFGAGMTEGKNIPKTDDVVKVEEVPVPEELKFRKLSVTSSFSYWELKSNDGARWLMVVHHNNFTVTPWPKQ